MSNVVRTDIDALNAVLTVSLPKEDYLARVQQEIRRYSQRSAMKGFRPGKTPQSLVKRMYGSAFLMDAVNDILQEKLAQYLTDNKVDMFGQPIPSKEQPNQQFDLKNPQDLTFKFDIGLLPEFELQGLDGVSYERYAVQIDEERVTEELEQVRRRTGSEEDVADGITETDILTLKVKEVGGSLENEIKVSTQWMTDDMKSVFLTQKKGDQLTVNIFQLEKETTPQYVRKYLLGLDEKDERTVNENFDVVIEKVSRIMPAELNEAFFTQNFGPEVTTEAQARDIIRQNLSSNYDAQADALLLRDMQEKLMEANQFQLPEDFLKRWLTTQNDRNTPETVEAGFESFAQNLRWTLVRSKIIKTSNVEVTEEDMRAYYANRVRGYLGGMAMNEEFINSLVDRVFQDEKQYNELYEDVVTEKALDAMKRRAVLVEKPVSKEELDSILAAARYEAAKSRGEITEQPETVAVEEVSAEAE